MNNCKYWGSAWLLLALAWVSFFVRILLVAVLFWHVLEISAELLEHVPTSRRKHRSFRAEETSQQTVSSNVSVVCSLDILVANVCRRVFGTTKITWPIMQSIYQIPCPSCDIKRTGKVTRCHIQITREKMDWNISTPTFHMTVGMLAIKCKKSPTTHHASRTNPRTVPEKITTSTNVITIWITITSRFISSSVGIVVDSEAVNKSIAILSNEMIGRFYVLSLPMEVDSKCRLWSWSWWERRKKHRYRCSPTRFNGLDLVWLRHLASVDRNDHKGAFCDPSTSDTGSLLRDQTGFCDCFPPSSSW